MATYHYGDSPTSRSTPTRWWPNAPSVTQPPTRAPRDPDRHVVGDLAGQLRLGHNCFRAGSVRVKADKHGDYQFATFSALALKCYTFRYVCAIVV